MRKNDRVAMVHSTVRFVAVVVGLTVLLSYNASDFDATEIKTILQLALVAFAGEGATQWLRRYQRGENSDGNSGPDSADF